MSEIVYTTMRLEVRRWTSDEAARLLAVYGDAEAMRWVGEGRALTEAECAQWVQVTLANYERRGYGMFALEEKATRAVVGYCGIVHPGDQVEAEVKYALLRSHLGRGLATEAVRGLLAYGAQSHGLTRMVATAASENLASHRVLLKAGLVRGAVEANDDGSRTQWFVWELAQ